LFRKLPELCLALLFTSTAWSMQLYNDPYILLLDLDAADHSRAALKSLRSDAREEHNSLIDACKKEEERLEQQLEAAREQLNGLNKSASGDTRQMAETRDGLHKIADAAGEPLRKLRAECEPAATAAFENKRAKLRVAEDWPQRRKEILRDIDLGRARERRFGDVEDIGYRKFFDGQEEDIAVGEQAVRQMRSSGMMPDPLPDTAVQEYVRQVAAKVAANSDLKVPLRVTVVDSSEISAIALPGGFLFISSGLVATAGSESELAGILSHEIARIAARHGTRASRRSRISSIFMQAAHVASGFFTGGFNSAAALNGINFGFQGLDAIVDRTLLAAQGKYEKEADQLGVQYAWKAGFDPRGFVMLLDSIARKDHSKTAGFFRTHPDLDERVLGAFGEVLFLPDRPGSTRDSVEFHRMRERIQN
jgi:hypothetical protein